MHSKERVRLLTAAILVFACLTTSFTGVRAAQPANLLNDFRSTQLLIATSSQRCILFDVYIAITPQQRSQGLMFIRQMDAYEGMIFLYPEPVQISMWMKNTLIPLDMLFINASNQVVSIHTGAVPLSTDIIKSGAEVNAVLELNAGMVKLLGIHHDDQIIFPASSI